MEKWLIFGFFIGLYWMQDRIEKSALNPNMRGA